MLIAAMQASAERQTQSIVMTPVHTVLLRYLAILLLGVQLGACALPQVKERTLSSALTAEESSATTLGRVLEPIKRPHSGKSGIMPLVDAHSAFAARMLMANSAEKTLDIQNYIWRNDNTGTLLLEALHKAADRGVRVRLLLDDNGIPGLDARLAALDSHPMIEVRLFNPFPFRPAKFLGYLTDFSRVNRRMHNKSFTVDNQVTIVGGRNIGDEYFGATDGVLFADLDLMAIGDVVRETSSDFDRYWASDSAYPASQILPQRPVEELRFLTEAANDVEQAVTNEGYVKALGDSQFIRDFLDGRHDFDWAKVEMISDDPKKGLGLAENKDFLMFDLQRILRQPRASVDLVSPYFVPTKTGAAGFSRLSAQGVKVRILTNALESTDVAAVHAGYAKHRKALLKAGIELYEMRRQGNASQWEQRLGPLGSSGSSLHAKTFTVDSSRVFVGSFNFDPRSARLNTELGFIVESPALAEKIQKAFESNVPELAYEVRLNDEGELYWIERKGEEELIYYTDPGTSFLKRLGVSILSVFPIDWLL
ncbi:phospholipase D family protein [Methylobacillus caricis]|uniref:phospholipase D family protein n=1 Tax=Methylobacillus caricis TaxID=1971611 RepID=UPI001CFFAC3C|nr:phospholipase D family protein [Methylobacillus caricis]MCB5186737.1 phospholipase D family protein [Methylobacillus caricis]